ncbi:hypothetical protein AVEN_73779-1 [Araneus ventricosus]|uniref:Uncharacterized protein n=1 Tax=Araneus ventricosus TaxID=182803 RepID=A0A4Y2WHF0_ARAVE|nr:hypothetical protein AVEN_73779-1 [Araneus ventricosus]
MRFPHDSTWIFSPHCHSAAKLDISALPSSWQVSGPLHACPLPADKRTSSSPCHFNKPAARFRAFAHFNNAMETSHPCITYSSNQGGPPPHYPLSACGSRCRHLPQCLCLPRFNSSWPSSHHFITGSHSTRFPLPRSSFAMLAEVSTEPHNFHFIHYLHQYHDFSPPHTIHNSAFFFFIPQLSQFSYSTDAQ